MCTLADAHIRVIAAALAQLRVSEEHSLLPPTEVARR